MPKVVPSQVVALIDSITEQDPTAVNRKKPDFPLDLRRATYLSAILALVDGIPEELLVLETRDFAEFVCAKTAIATAFDKSQRRSRMDDSGAFVELKPIHVTGEINPVFVLRDILARCPDASPSDKASNLLFIESDYRDELRLDLGSVHQALSQGEWKAATVLAGSLVEALLLWAIRKQAQTEIDNAIQRLVGTKLQKKPSSDLDRWDLFEHLAVAHALGLIQNATETQIGLAKDFRNLIHPGRSIRKNQVCNRGTALSAVAAVELVVVDLERWFPPIP